MARSKFSWFRGLHKPKVIVSEDDFGLVASMPSPYTKGIHESKPLPQRGYAPSGLEDFAPIRVKAPESRPTNKVPLRTAPEYAGESTVRRSAAMTQYSLLSSEERADWIYEKTVKPYDPEDTCKLSKPTDPIRDAVALPPTKVGTVTQWDTVWHGMKCELVPFIGPTLENGDYYTPKPRKVRAVAQSE